MRSRIKILGPVVPATPLPHRHLHLSGHEQMAQDIPGAGRESRPPRQGSTLLDLRELLFSSEVFWMHPMVHERGEGYFVRVWRGSIAGVFAGEVTAIYHLFGHRYGCDHPFADPGYHCAATELGQSVVGGVSCQASWGHIPWDGSSPEREVQRATATPSRLRR